MTQTLQNKPVVIFDLGNVVLNWDVNLILDSLGQSNTIRKLIQKELFRHNDWLDMDHGKKSEPMVISDICRRSSLTPEMVGHALLTAKKSLLHIPETIELMHEFKNKGIDMYCLSNMSVETYETIKNQDFFNMFRGTVISGIEKCMKPDKKIYRLILDRYKLEAYNTIFIDDSLPNIEAAKNLGIVGFHFKRSPSCYSKIRDMLIL